RLSMLRSPIWPDPTADRGKHSIEYALYPHEQTWRQAQTIHRGYELNNPLIAVMADAHQGSLPEEYSFIRLEPANLVLTTVKKAEDSDAWIVQWYETDGKDVDAVLTLPNSPQKVLTTNVMEEDGTVVPSMGKSVNIPTKKYSTKTVKVYFGK
ncbi:MAG TPA: glycosyl hydrolase-related protein, partial [Bacteroidota bacterium]|nr:glycosyl hydrolase-related protein [Bacteroidota bacterium]